MAHLTQEQARILFFNRDGNLVLGDRVWAGTAVEVEVRFREVIEHALALGSPTLVFAHNHPSGEARPSEQDIRYTQRLARICKDLEILLYDHVIVSRNGSSSFRTLGLM